MHPAPSDGHWEGELEMSISVLCHELNKTGQVWIDTDKPRVDTLSTQTKAIPRDKWQAVLMPYLTAAHARWESKIVCGWSDTHIHSSLYGQMGLTPWKRIFNKLQRVAQFKKVRMLKLALYVNMCDKSYKRRMQPKTANWYFWQCIHFWG